ncbi:MAG: peptide-methionine (R)-S-oxide reductase MsrB [Bauldia sp.]|nr:peptide-methionine (R)-S-oxide reductase MsrB [Bauldia sp.]
MSGGKKVLTKRQFLTTLSAVAVTAGAAALLRGRPGFAAEGSFEITKTDEEWLRLLGRERFGILRRQGTEAPWTSELLNEHRAGTFACGGCDLALYSSETKYESGTGWPSFWDALPEAVGTEEDRSYFMLRTELHCARCGGHLGHLFDDGPQPTGLRHCINGLSLTFHPSPAA